MNKKETFVELYREGDLSNYISCVNHKALITCFLDHVDLVDFSNRVKHTVIDIIKTPRFWGFVGLVLLGSYPEEVFAVLPVNSSKRSFKKGRKLGGSGTYEEYRGLPPINVQSTNDKNNNSLVLFIIQTIFIVLSKLFEKQKNIEPEPLTKIQKFKKFIASINLIDLINTVILIVVLVITTLTYNEFKNSPQLLAGEPTSFGPQRKPEPPIEPLGGPIQRPTPPPIGNDNFPSTMSFWDKLKIESARPFGPRPPNAPLTGLKGLIQRRRWDKQNEYYEKKKNK